MRVLIVEDEAKVASFIARAFGEEGIETAIAPDGLSGADVAERGGFDLIVLDLGLPGLDGFGFLERIRANSVACPVLVLTARDAVADRVRGLEAGADDYLPKPFAFEELLARTRALVRRSQGQAPQVVRVADLVLDQRTRKARRGETEIALSNREYALLEYLMSRARRVVTRSMIAEQVWGTDYDAGSNTIDVYINYLRSKIDAGREPKLIKTVRGRGYCIGEEAPGSPPGDEPAPGGA